MTLCAEDGDAIVEMVLKGPLIVAHSLAIGLCIAVGAIMMGTSVLLGLIGISFIVLLTVRG